MSATFTNLCRRSLSLYKRAIRNSSLSQNNCQKEFFLLRSDTLLSHLLQYTCTFSALCTAVLVQCVHCTPQRVSWVNTCTLMSTFMYTYSTLYTWRTHAPPKPVSSQNNQKNFFLNYNSCLRRKIFEYTIFSLYMCTNPCFLLKVHKSNKNNRSFNPKRINVTEIKKLSHEKIFYKVLAVNQYILY